MRFPVKSGGDFKSCPSGSHFAVCDIVADLGIQPGFGGFGEKQRIFIRFEIPAERVKFEKDGRMIEGPQVIGSFLTASMHKKANLRKFLEGWRGKQFTDEEAGAFEIEAVLGKSCMLTVVESQKEDGSIRADISSVSPLPKGAPKLTAENPLIFYDDQHKEQFAHLSKKIQEKIAGQIVVKPKLNPTAPEDDYGDISGSFTATDDDLPDFDDPIPF